MSSSSRKLVIGNWKMNPATLEDAKRIARKTRAAAARLSHTEVAICPPLPFILACRSRLESDPIALGAQTVSFDESGAHTGEVGADMLRSLGVRYVITGHSEERDMGDTDEIVSKRIMRINEAGLIPIVCFGEKSHEESGAHFDFLKEQIKATFAGISASKARSISRRIILAYEPVWAIGAKEALAPEQIYEMSLFIKKVFSDIFGREAGAKVKVLYGGSVNFRNAGEIIRTGQVDGLLVGRESVNMPGFIELLKAVDAVE